MAEKTIRKQLLLRLSDKLYSELATWAEDDFRSLNGQVEFLLTQCVEERKRFGRLPSPSEE